MSDLISAAKQALEALDNAQHFIDEYAAAKYIHAHNAAITSLRQAIAEAEKQEQGEPVAWGMEGKDGFIFDVICPAEHEREEGGYTTPLYTTPQQRTWVGLTDEDKKQIAKEANYNWEMTTGEYAERIGRLTESKLKEKNTIIKTYPEKDKT